MANWHRVIWWMFSESQTPTPDPAAAREKPVLEPSHPLYPLLDDLTDSQYDSLIFINMAVILLEKLDVENDVSWLVNYYSATISQTIRRSVRSRELLRMTFSWDLTAVTENQIVSQPAEVSYSISLSTSDAFVVFRSWHSKSPSSSSTEPMPRTSATCSWEQKVEMNNDRKCQGSNQKNVSNNFTFLNTNPLESKH